MLEEGEMGEYGGEDEMDEDQYSEQGEIKNRDCLDKQSFNDFIDTNKDE